MVVILGDKIRGGVWYFSQCACITLVKQGKPPRERNISRVTEDMQEAQPQ